MKQGITIAVGLLTLAATAAYLYTRKDIVDVDTNTSPDDTPVNPVVDDDLTPEGVVS